MSTTVDTPAVTLVDTSEGAWTGFLRRHRQLNSHYFGGRLSEPEIEFADLDEATNGTYSHRKGEPVIKLARALIEGRPFLSDSYATTAATARLAETLQHELCHQAATELYGYPPTGDDVADHRTFGFRAACDASTAPKIHDCCQQNLFTGDRGHERTGVSSTPAQAGSIPVRLRYQRVLLALGLAVR